MFKNVASQKIEVYAFDSTTGAPKTGDAANLTAYVSKDFGAVTVLGDTSATELDATNAKGLYIFDLTQAETNADHLQFSGKSSTSNIFIVPRWIETFPNRLTTMVIDAAGLVDANTVKLGPTGSGTAQTARDVGASVITASGTVTTVTNQLTAAQIATGVWTDTTAGDFTTALSVGKSVMNGVSLGTGLTVNDITTKTGYSLSGSQTFNVTGNITGNLSGSVGSVTGAVGSVTGAVGSVTGAVGSVTGNVGGNVVGSVASVTARVTANTDQINGVALAASNLSKSAKAIVRGTCSGGSTTTAVVSSMTTPASLTATGQLIGRTILFDDDTTTAALQGQASNITNSTTGSTPTITFTAMTTAPANTDTFSVV